MNLRSWNYAWKCYHEFSSSALSHNMAKWRKLLLEEYKLLYPEKYFQNVSLFDTWIQGQHACNFPPSSPRWKKSLFGVKLRMQDFYSSRFERILFELKVANFRRKDSRIFYFCDFVLAASILTTRYYICCFLDRVRERRPQKSRCVGQKCSKFRFYFETVCHNPSRCALALLFVISFCFH